MTALDANWRKSTASNNSGQCVEARHLNGMIEVRDSKDRNGPILRFTVDEWTAFLDGARADQFEAPA